ncbi:hypothetical protein HPG69_009369 [Diceros bicornis minor]|uniref:Alpha-defensin N-terminal domain-containing protein n=1 Tax=Diceros bicornis minor TaxID=77932 RepID=A0A7J7E426_DICBM|nr:hypothetical protein HPG69_009369 [Diceros bicornis minor]
MRTLTLLTALLVLSLQAEAQRLEERADQVPGQDQPGAEVQDVTNSFAGDERSAQESSGVRSVGKESGVLNILPQCRIIQIISIITLVSIFITQELVFKSIDSALYLVKRVVSLYSYYRRGPYQSQECLSEACTLSVLPRALLSLDFFNPDTKKFKIQIDGLQGTVGTLCVCP